MPETYLVEALVMENAKQQSELRKITRIKRKLPSVCLRTYHDSGEESPITGRGGFAVELRNESKERYSALDLYFRFN